MQQKYKMRTTCTKYEGTTNFNKHLKPKIYIWELGYSPILRENAVVTIAVVKVV